MVRKIARAAERRSPGRPARLSRDLVLSVAKRLVAERGLAALTMRLLADELGATPMALYRHVGDRDELALLVIDDVLSAVAIPDDRLAAVPWLRELAVRVRAAGLAHPGVMDVLLEEGPVVRSALVVLDRVVRKLHAEGMSWAAAAAVHNTFMSWLAATVRREERWAARPRDGVTPPMKRFLETAAKLSPDEYPGVAHALEHMPGPDVDTEFQRSLAFMLGAVEARLGEPPKKRVRAKT